MCHFLPAASGKVSVDSISHEILAEIYRLEYLDIAEEACIALERGDKLGALALAIEGYKILGKYEHYLNLLIFG